MKVIIPAAGRGTRMAPITRGKPKEMLPVAGKPAISFVIEELRTSGINEIGIIINKQKQEIRAYLTRYYPSVRFSFFYQKKPIGILDAISLAQTYVGKKPFGIIMPDAVFVSEKPAFGELKKTYKKNLPYLSGLFYVDKHMARGFGNCGRINAHHLSAKLWRIQKVSDKKPGYFTMRGKRSVLRGNGRVIVPASFFDLIEEERKNVRSGELDDVPIWQKLAREGALYGCLMKGRGFDTGNPIGYHECDKYFNTNNKFHIKSKKEINLKLVLI